MRRWRQYVHPCNLYPACRPHIANPEGHSINGNAQFLYVNPPPFRYAMNDMRQAFKNDTALHRSVTRKILLAILTSDVLVPSWHSKNARASLTFVSRLDVFSPGPICNVIFFIVFVEFMGRMWAWKSNVILCMRAIVFWSGNRVKLLILYPMKRVFPPGVTAFSPTHRSNIGEFISRSTVTRLNKSHS
jgi:hypothetical protein